MNEISGKRRPLRAGEAVLLLGLGAALGGAGTGCRHHVVETRVQIVQVVPAPPALTIENHKPTEIAALWAKPCGAGESGYRLLEGVRIPPSSTAVVPLADLPECADLSARDGRGEAVGMQADMRLAPGAHWTIE
ncbi:MAG: hypothetical protein U0359_02075 [Byssovorax sp.]